MRKGIHPKYELCQVSCACGNSFETRSVLEKIRIDICGQCHPFYTGKQKFVDTAGRVDKFRRRYGRKAPESGAPESGTPASGAPESGAPETG